MNNYNNFELLLFAASEEYCNKEAKMFLEIDSSIFSTTQVQQKKFHKIIRESQKRKTISKIYLLAIACMICLSLCFTACMCIPEIRTTIKNVCMEWYDKYIAVGFFEGTSTLPQDNTTCDIDESSLIPPPIVLESPSKIEHKAKLTYLPRDYIMDVDLDNENYYSVSYYIGEEFVFSFTQNIINQDLNWADIEGQAIQKTLVGDFEALILIDINNPGFYSLIWQDYNYEYNIVGMFSGVDELIRIAEGVKI